MEFSPALWDAAVDHVTIKAEESVSFTLRKQMEISAKEELTQPAGASWNDVIVDLRMKQSGSGGGTINTPGVCSRSIGL